MQTEAVDFAAVKERQRQAWESGDYPRVGNTLQIIAERLVDAAGVRAGERVLDVACGQGNAALSAARRFADATGVDYAANLLAQGRERAEAEHLVVTFTEGDAERMPFPDGSFDLTVSTVGAMFAPDHQRTADEIARVTATGGTIALASWTPDSLVGHMFKLIGAWAPPPPGVRPPMLWGTPEHLADLFGGRVDWVGLTRREHVFRFHSPEHFSQWFRLYYGPITRLVGTLSAPDQARFADELAGVARQFNRAEDGRLVAPSAYLEAVGVRRA